MPAFSSSAASHAIGKFGYGAIGLAVGIESTGVPFPGESTVIAAALYAGATHRLNIVLIVAVAAAGAIVGDNIGFLVGRMLGFPLLLRYGRHIRMTPARIKLGQYLFLRHGGKVVFFGRFVAILRALAAFLAGTNRMEWPRFLLFNAAGGTVWAAIYGFGPYFLGETIQRLSGPIGIALGIAAALAVIAAGVFVRKNEKRLEQEAEKALPGPLRQHRHAAPR
jgi:membrane protein DedA with SNARE-associated domain